MQNRNATKKAEEQEAEFLKNRDRNRQHQNKKE